MTWRDSTDQEKDQRPFTELMQQTTTRRGRAMSSYHVLFIASILLASGTASLAAAPSNPSFEDLPDLIGWTDLTGPHPGTVSVLRTSDTTDGSAFARLEFTGSCASGCGCTEWGPILRSSNFTPASGATIRVDFRAIETFDDYAIRGFLKNSATNTVVSTLFDTTGNGTTSWTTSTVVVPGGGPTTYFLEFQAGSFDATHGCAIGARLELDNIRVWPVECVRPTAKDLVALDGAAGDGFGIALALDGSMAVVGSYAATVGGNVGQGAAYVLGRHQGGTDNWGLVKKLVASDGAAGERFGRAVAIDGDTIAVGAWQAAVSGKTGQGAVYIFARNQGGANNWGQVKKVTASDGTYYDYFGWALALSGDTLVVGAWGDDDNGSQSGSAYIFLRNQGGANNWGQLKKISAAPDSAADDYFGYSLTLDGDTLVVGAYGDDVGSYADHGSAFIFQRNQGGADNWGLLKKITQAPDSAASDVFGFAVALDGDTLVVGAQYDDDRGNASGSAYVFARDEGGTENWGLVKKLTGSDGAANDFFGRAVAISADKLVVGANGDNVGANADQGSAYLFASDEGGTDNWGEVKKLTAPDGAANDFLGWAVAVSGDAVLAGAYAAGFEQGAAYFFTDEPIPGCGEHWVGYKIAHPKKDLTGVEIPGNAFPAKWALTLNDVQLADADADDPENFVAKKAQSLLAVAQRDTGPLPATSDLSYLRYLLGPAKESVQAPGSDGKYPKPAKHILRVWQLDTDFGSINVASKKASALLVPAAADLAGSPAAPGDTTHYACYKVKATKDVTEQTPDKGDGTGKLRKDLQAFFGEELFSDCAVLADGTTPSFAGTAVQGMCLFDLKKPVELCNPVSTSAVVPPRQSTAVFDASTARTTQSMLCYQVKLASKVTSAEAAALIGAGVGDKLDPAQAKHVKHALKDGNPVYTTAGSQFPWPVVVDSKKQDVVCVPARVVGASAAP
jgi:hypothetical protein